MYCQQRVLKGLSGDYQKKKRLGGFLYCILQVTDCKRWFKRELETLKQNTPMSY